MDTLQTTSRSPQWNCTAHRVISHAKEDFYRGKNTELIAPKYIHKTQIIIEQTNWSNNYRLLYLCVLARFRLQLIDVTSRNACEYAVPESTQAEAAIEKEMTVRTSA